MRLGTSLAIMTALWGIVAIACWQTIARIHS